MKRRHGGYTLVELIMAMGMATLVLAAVVYISASMIRFAAQGSVRGDVSTWTLFGLSQLNKEIEGATHIEKPDVGGVGTDYLNGCSNWAMDWTSKGVGGQLDSANLVNSFYYGVCKLQSQGKDTDGNAIAVQVLVRCAKSGVCPYNKDGDSANGFLPSALPSAPPAAAPSCTDAGAGKLPTDCEVVARHIYKQKPNTDYYFKIAAAKPNVVEMHFTLGVATGNIKSSGKAPGAQIAASGLDTPTPQFLKIDKSIRFNNPYGNNMEAP